MMFNFFLFKNHKNELYIIAMILLFKKVIRNYIPAHIIFFNSRYNIMNIVIGWFSIIN